MVVVGVVVVDRRSRRRIHLNLIRLGLFSSSECVFSMSFFSFYRMPLAIAIAIAIACSC